MQLDELAALAAKATPKDWISGEIAPTITAMVAVIKAADAMRELYLVGECRKDDVAVAYDRAIAALEALP